MTLYTGFVVLLTPNIIDTPSHYLVFPFLLSILYLPVCSIQWTDSAVSGGMNGVPLPINNQSYLPFDFTASFTATQSSRDNRQGNQPMLASLLDFSEEILVTIHLIIMVISQS